MLKRIIEFMIRRHAFVLAVMGLLVITGLVSLFHMSFDAFPDTSSVMVQVNTTPQGYVPEDVESQITAKIEQELSGLAGLEEIRSISKSGLSQVTCVFEDGTDIYRARQQISEKLSAVELPDGVNPPELGPISTGLGEIFHYIVIDTTGAITSARETQDWLIKPRMQAVPGVVEVNSWGGFKKQYQVQIDPVKLASMNITVNQVIEALSSGNHNVGGGFAIRADEQISIQGVGALKKREDIEEIVIETRKGIPIHIRDIGEVVIGHELRAGAVTYNGKGEAVLGMGFMLTGENSQTVAGNLANRLEEVKKSLPPSTDVHTVYDRTHLVDEVLDTVKHNLLFGAALVMAVLFFLLGNIRASLIVASAIPLSMLFAFDLMYQAGIMGSLMSLGAIDFGLAVDNAVIQVENVIRRTSHPTGNRSRVEVIRDAIMEVMKPALFGQMIIMLVYVPILTLEGTEGKLFHPMALTVIFVLAGSLLLSFTVIPALCSVMLPKQVSEHETKLVSLLKRYYQPTLEWAMRRSKMILSFAAIMVIASFVLFSRLGGEFIPRLSEGSIVINLIRLSGISLDQSVDNGLRVEKILLEKFPDEIKEIWSRTGTAEVATDPMGPELTDTYMTLNPRKQWKKAKTQEELVMKMDEELSDFPGMNMAFSQPIELRMNEMTEGGIRSDIGVKLFGDNLDSLVSKAAEIEEIMKNIKGAADVSTEQITGSPLLRIEIDRKNLARYGLTSEEVLQAIQTLGGTPVGEVREGQRAFDLVAKFTDRYSKTPEAIDRLLLPSSSGELVPLTKVTKFEQIEGPSTISREWSKRKIIIQCNVRGRDVSSFANEIRDRMDKELKFEPGYFTKIGGQFEHLEAARTRLAIVVPIVLLLIFAVLYWSFGSIRDALIIFSGVPLAAVGGISALVFRGMPFTISAGVGFIALSGIAVLNGLVLVSSIRNLQSEGISLSEAIHTSGSLRMRPVIMTALVAAIGFVPMAISSGVGAEVQRPLATVVIGGIITSTLLTLIVLPVLYSKFGRAQKEVVSA